MDRSFFRLNSETRPFGLTVVDSGGLINIIQKELDFIGYYGDNIKNRRISEFFLWLEKNEKFLEERFFEFFPISNWSKEVNFHILGIWLGGEFISDKYGKAMIKNMPKLNISESGFQEGEERMFRSQYHYDSEEHEIRIPTFRAYMVTKNLSLEECFIEGFNTGIHEYTHALHKIEGNTSSTALTEISTAYAQSKHSLPIKIETINKTGLSNLGIRYFPTMLKEFESGALDIEISTKYLSEYFSFLVSPWIIKYYGENFDIMKFKYDENENFKGEIVGTDIYLLGGSKLLFGIPRFYKKMINGMFFYNGSDFCKSAGITDERLIYKFEDVFFKLSNSTWDTQMEFFNIFIDVMNEVFGFPNPEDIPEGFVSVFPKKEDLTNLFKDITPVKVG
ncbi:hypothetical protein KO317_03075 [Candidatus Micrarchaeota archaeon]|nr:hypothetical protein [Candidatus Micrarchaeota archaeon]